MYNYIEEMKKDIIEQIKEDANYNGYDLQDLLYNREETEEKLHDDLWINDSVTGNLAGSYYCNRYKARCSVLDNLNLCAEALREFGTPAEEIGNRFLNQDWEWLDVIIRCCLLCQAINEALDELEEELTSEE